MILLDFGFLLVGLGTGLLVAFSAVLAMMSWMHHMFIMEVHRQAYAWMTIPWVLLVSGLTILYRHRRRI